MSPVNSEKVSFPAADGVSSLAARLDVPKAGARAYVLFAHCFTCGKDVLAASRISERLTGHGFGVLRFDFTGLGASDGEFANTNFSSNVGDLIAAAEWLGAEREAPKLLIGHSLGGAAVLAAAARIPSATAVCTIAAPADPTHVSRLFEGAMETIERDGEAEVSLAGRSFRITRQFLDDIQSQNLEPLIANLRKPLLVFHAPTDQIVGIDNASHIFRAAKHPKSFVSLDDADHLLSRREDSAYVADVIAGWATRYVAPGGEQPKQQVSAPPGAVTVSETGEGKFAQAISVGGAFSLRADEPVEYGGTGTGPSPYDYLLAALGSCTTMTMRLYAERKGLPMERASVTLTHTKIHAEDCEQCETESGKIDRIEREIEVTGPLDGDSRRKLLEIVDKCPVHRTLHSEVSVLTRMK